jgi:predicted AAA+ superfamily ATPase
MSAPRVVMSLAREIFRLKFAAHLSHRQIAAALRIGVGTVSNYLAAFERARLEFPLPAELDDALTAAVSARRRPGSKAVKV